MKHAHILTAITLILLAFTAFAAINVFFGLRSISESVTRIREKVNRMECESYGGRYDSQEQGPNAILAGACFTRIERHEDPDKTWVRVTEQLKILSK